ncbi:unnamed protein product [Ceutorhynchus assimilis]|uniref:MD-2-related lipid-recognition domain-containing protein n=1 Tax=Ceutorhynchus assimilis TaxID=467358 RepID=A0A9N9MDY0_9CUCU|nr:unnamed protein product [Ceutorhynchus assimilis]
MVVAIATATVVAMASQNRKLFLNKVTNCKGYENSTLNWYDVTIERDPTTKDFTFSLKLRVIKEVSTKLEIEFNVWKCDAAGSLDSCEYFIKGMKNKNICQIISQKHTFWSPFVEHFQPPLRCPIKPGVYESKKVPFQSSLVQLFPGNSFWKSQMKGFDNGLIISCAETDLKVNTERHG